MIRKSRRKTIPVMIQVPVIYSYWGGRVCAQHIDISLIDFGRREWVLPDVPDELT